MTLSKYYELARTDLFEKITYFWNQLFGALFISIILFIFLQIWTTLGQEQGLLQGYTVPQLLWYLAFAEVILFSSGNEWLEKIGEEVRSGALGLHLLKPMNYVGAKFSLHFENFLYSFFSIGIFAFSVCYFLVGPIPVSITTVLTAFIAATLGALLNFFFITTLGLLAFWLEDVSSIWWIYSKLLFIIGGMLIPLDLYPDWLQAITNYLPFSYIMYWPAKILVNYAGINILSVFGMQLLWILIAAFILTSTYLAGIRQVNMHGG